MENNNTFLDAIRYNTESKRFFSYDTPEYIKFKNSLCGISVGDIVKLRTGSAPIRVEEIRKYGTIRGTYTKSGKKVDWRSASDFEPYIEENNIERFEMQNRLFVTRSDPARYGKGITELDTNRYLLEMKDNGAYEAFNSADVKLVIPYSYAVKFDTSGREYDYRGKEGSVAVGDILLSYDNFSFVQVTKVNTESEKATKEFNGVKLLTAPIA